MKKRLRFIIIPFTLSFAIMVMLAFYAVKRFNTLSNYSQMVEHTYDVMSEFDRLEIMLKDIDKNERGYLLTRDSQYLKALKPMMSNIFPITEEIKKIVTDNEDSHQDLIWIRSYLVNRVENLNADIAYKDTAKSDLLPPTYDKGKVDVLQIQYYIQKMKDREKGLLKDRMEKKTAYQQLTYSSVKYLFFIFSFVTLFLFVVMMRELNKRFKYQEELQVKLIDLQRSHSELEQIAFAASHDLKEPLRKIQVFTNKILYQKKIADQETINSLERIQASASRMQELIDDLGDLTSLVQNQGEKQQTSLNAVVKEVLLDLDPKIKQKQSLIQVTPLISINGYPAQLQLLFKALIDNSIKFSQEGKPLNIRVSGQKVTGIELAGINQNLVDKVFYKVTVTDNGIGFDNKFMHKMFLLFQRLHNQRSEYEGKGTGLAICQRVMANHLGYILADGLPDEGATFKLYFPLEG